MIYRFVVEVYAGQIVSESFIFTMICMVWVIFFSIMSATTQLIKNVDQSQSNTMMKTISVSLALIFVTHMIIGRFTSIWIVLVPVAVQAVATLCFDQLTSMYISKRFPGRKEHYGIFKQFQNGFAALVVIGYISLPDGIFRLINAVSQVTLAVWLTSIL